MPSNRYRVIRRALQPDERLLWSGSPRGGVLLKRSHRVFIAFLVIVVLIVGGCLATGRLIPAPLVICIPFIVIGLFTVLDGFLFDPRRRSRTAYALTDRRVLKIEGVNCPEITALPLGSLSKIELTERRAGSGTIWCLSPHDRWPKTNRRNLPKPHFRLIVDARHVHALLLEARAATFAGPGQAAPGDLHMGVVEPGS